MDEVYRGYRVTVKRSEGLWIARITHVRGNQVRLHATSTEVEGPEACLGRAKRRIDDLVNYLNARDGNIV